MNNMRDISVERGDFKDNVQGRLLTWLGANTNSVVRRQGTAAKDMKLAMQNGAAIPPAAMHAALTVVGIDPAHAVNSQGTRVLLWAGHPQATSTSQTLQLKAGT